MSWYRCHACGWDFNRRASAELYCPACEPSLVVKPRQQMPQGAGHDDAAVQNSLRVGNDEVQ